MNALCTTTPGLENAKGQQSSHSCPQIPPAFLARPPAIPTAPSALMSCARLSLAAVAPEESADTYRDHVYRGQDKYANGPKWLQNAPPEGQEYIFSELDSLYKSCIVRPREVHSEAVRAF